jgi:chromosome segregation ATPase
MVGFAVDFTLGISNFTLGSAATLGASHKNYRAALAYVAMDDEFMLSESSLALLDQLQRKDQMFAKLSGFLQEIQQTGNSVDEWQEKLDELDASRQANAELQSKLQGLSQQNNSLQSANVELNASVQDLQNDMVQLNDAVLQEQGEAEKLRAYLDSVEVDGRGKEGLYQERVESLQKENDDAREKLQQVSQVKTIPIRTIFG